MRMREAFDQPGDGATLERLGSQLSGRAEQSGAAEITYRTVDTPIGVLLLAATEAGVVRIAFESEGQEAVLAQLAERLSPQILPAASRLDPAARQIEEYFTGARRTFDLPLDLRLARGFRHQVLHHLLQVPFGGRVSYAQLAVTTGNPGAVRAVGSACARNPLPVVVPCHRVLRSDGKLGGYLGGLATKQALLDLEQGTLAAQ